jgi:CheY-like chemotaxis protein
MLFDAVQDALAAIATAASGHNPAAPRPVELRQRLRGMRLLVVEDNKINQMVAQGLLTQEGADVTLADDGQRGVEAVSNTQPAFDVVLMDLQMPVMDGFEATRAIRQQLGMAGLPIVAMTANAMASDRAACLAAGMNDHVGKPFELDHLVATLLHQAGREATPALPARPLPPIPAEPVAEAGSAGDLDVQGALARLGGDRDIYASVLQTFSTELQQIPLQVAQALSAGEWSDAARALHTLKGLSGTLGARQLATVAAQLEKACKDNSAQAEVEGMLAVLQQAISALEPNLLQALLQYAPDEPVPGQSPLTPLDRTAFLRDLQALERQLSESDMAALEVYRLVQETYGAHLAQEIKPLKDAMAALDFAKALGVCKDLLRNA